MTNFSPLAAIRQRWWLVASLALVGAILGAAPRPQAVSDEATTYNATHTMLANSTTDATIVAPSQVTLLATAGEVPARVAARIGYAGPPAQLASRIVAVFDFETGALTIATAEETAADAELIADAFAEELNAYLAELQDVAYQERLTASRDRLAELEDELGALTFEIGADPENPTLLAQLDAISRQYSTAFEQNDVLEEDPVQLTFTTLERAQAIADVDSGLSAPTSRSTRGVMGLIVGTVLGAVAAIVLGRLDTKIRSREQAEELMAMRARVIIPLMKQADGGIVVGPGRQDALSDTYRTVRNVVGFVQSGLPAPVRAAARITLVVSPGPGDGKTSLAANLAAAFNETGERTIVVNTDFRRPRLFEAITGRRQPESAFELHELADLPRRALPITTTEDDLKLLDLSNVEGSPGELARETIRQISRLTDIADQIVIDTSPVGATAEVLDLLPYADVIVVVAKVGHTRIQSTERTVAILRDIATAPMLLVLGGIKAKRNPYYEYVDRRRAAHDAQPVEEDVDLVEAND